MKSVSTFATVNLRAIGAALFALIVLGVAETSHAEEHKGPPPAVVEVGQAASARLAPSRWVPGSVVSRDDAKIASAEAGRLEYVAEVGTRVKSGERLAKLDDKALVLRREEIQSDVARAEAQRALSAVQLQRLDKLATSNSVAKTQIDEAR